MKSYEKVEKLIKNKRTLSAFAKYVEGDIDKDLNLVFRVSAHPYPQFLIEISPTSNTPDNMSHQDVRILKLSTARAINYFSKKIFEKAEQLIKENIANLKNEVYEECEKMKWKLETLEDK